MGSMIKNTGESLRAAPSVGGKAMKKYGPKAA
jgi:hypothetical protein